MPQNKFKTFLKSMHPGYQTLNLEYPVDMKPRYGHGQPSHAALYRIINANRETYKKWLVKAMANAGSLVAIKDKPYVTNITEPHWNNGFLPGLDIVMLYTILASCNPSTYVEIGSGNSTKVAHKAKKDFSLVTKIISIDPHPRSEIDKLSDTVYRVPFEKTDLALFAGLKKGDIVFVDNSHRVFPNSDATVFFLDVLPILPAGVMVHLHDIYLPDDYPQEMCDRYYSEQYMLAGFLLANPARYRTFMPCYFVSEDKELSSMLIPFWEHLSMPKVERHGGSFWLEIGEN
jgi:hypothetical protein